MAGGQFGQAEASLSGHAFAETYLEEKGIWTFTDPTSGIIRVEAPSGTPLNTIQLFFLAMSGSKGQDLRQTCASENAVSSNPFDLEANSIGHYFRRDTIFSFPSFKHLWLPEKYRRLASPDLTFSLQPRKSS